jgi:hypothetical protein
MEKPLTALNKVDIVLSFLANSVEAKPSITDGPLFSALQKRHPQLEKQSDFGSDLHRILNKLVKEGFVDTIESNVGNPRRYFITFDGKLLHEEGGYEKAVKDKDARKQWEDSLILKGEKNGERLNTLTLILGIGTIALVLVEVVKFIYELRHPCS